MSDKINEFRKLFTDYIHQLQNTSNILHNDKQEEYANIRKFKIETVVNADIFYIDNYAEMIVPEYIDNLYNFGVIAASNNKPIFSGRWVIPIKDQYNLVMGLVGWSDTSDVKYLFSNTKYFRRGDDIYGLESLKYIFERNRMIVVEGIADVLRLRDIGFKEAVATNGTMYSWWKSFIFNSVDNVIFIPDRDQAGLGTNKIWKSKKAIRLIIPITDGRVRFKDIDEYVRGNNENEAYINEYINKCFEYLSEKVVSGVVEEVSMIS